MFLSFLAYFIPEDVLSLLFTFDFMDASTLGIFDIANEDSANSLI